MDQLLLATYSLDNLLSYRRYAEQIGCGLELHTFTEPAVLAGDVNGMVEAHRRQLDGFEGLLGFHGAFYDMASASLDPAVVALTLERYRQNLEIAARLRGTYVVFHANYMGGFKLVNYRPGWHERQVKFWRAFAAEAAAHGIYILLENMWADDPTIIVDILREVGSPYLKACLDFAHATLFSPYSLDVWIDTLAPYVFCCHLNNNDGKMDLHWPLGQGVIPYEMVLTRLRHLPCTPFMTLEMPDLHVIQESVGFFRLPVPVELPRHLP